MTEWPGASASEIERLEALYRESTRDVPAFGSHPSEEDWERLAADELSADKLSADERTALADHIVACQTCRDTYRVVMDLRRQASPSAGVRPLSRPERGTPPLADGSAAAPRWSGRDLALAAAVLVSIAAGVWSWSLRSRVGTLEAQLGAAQPAGEIERLEAALRQAEGRASRLERELADQRQPGIDAPIVDLEPEVVRGDGRRRTEVAVPDGARYVTLVFTFTTGTVPGAPFTMEIVRADGTRLGAWPGVAPGAFQTLSVVVPADLVPPGEYTVRLVDGSGAAMQTHRVLVRRGSERSEGR